MGKDVSNEIAEFSGLEDTEISLIQDITNQKTSLNSLRKCLMSV